MKNVTLSLSLAIVCLSCSSTKSTSKDNTSQSTTVAIDTSSEKVASPEPEKKIMRTMLVGKEDRKALEEAPFNTWYTTNYSNYSVNKTLIPDITNGLNGVTVTTFMGTWCGDSKRETPRMFKILDVANFDNSDLELITVDRTKQNPTEFTSGQNIKRVPTFIFKRDGKEIGRIVERPIESLEKDMIKILNGETYKHAYEK
ncbi:thioredoxin family protein [Dokdonia sp. Hel_I_53]|uniref:thioredoxin family protein n=1 Tax=Dokdonia sp. Hel_I_53 TaxID=1566287 RepID=UPI001199EB89|nr:thioredoxin family protein [Dokdonia sp. Hel_I_53]TVZ53011.1 thioredoxin-like protein [Dokdonia sp. Hel_I_53]